MKIKDLKISTQLKLGFAVLLLFVVVLGIVSHLMNDQIFQQTETMYNHPLQVRKAIGSLDSDILSMRLGTRDLMLAKSDQEKQDAVQLMELAAVDALRQFEMLRNQYLGSQSDVDEAFESFMKWKIAREENTRLALSGDIEKVKQSVLSTGTVGIYRDQMLAKIHKIDDFAKNKADNLLASSTKLRDELNNQLLLLVVVILLLSLLINYLLLHNIRKPLSELTDATQHFRSGNMDARSSYASQNEFGKLSDSFNALAANIQRNLNLEEKSANITRLMLNEDDASEFFKVTLSALVTHTGSQMAAVYLLADDKKTFVHFESIGLDDNAKKSFDANNFEGEFGYVLSSKKVRHLKNISEDTRFVFHTVSGKFIPREILTLPILAGNEVIAIVTLASINVYDQQSIQLIDYILDIFSARVEGILAYRKIKEFSEKLAQAGAYNRRLIEASIDPLVTIGPDGRITDVNNSTETITGLSREELINTDFADYFTEPEIAKAGYQQVFRDGFVHDYELAIRHIDGKITPVLYNATVYRNESGQVIGVFAAARDITEQKRNERELHALNQDLIQRSEKLASANRELEQQSKEMAMQADELKEYNIELELQKKQLDEANQLKSAFLSNMSHELRTPLNSVIALSGVLNRRLKTQIPEDEYNYLGIIEKNGKQLLSLINDILDLSRIEAGKEVISYTRFPVQQVVKNILDTLLPIATEKGISLISRVPEDLLPIVSDSTKCHHILQNIISNAVKFTENGTVEVTAEMKNGKFHIGIKDTGIGISDEHLPFIFDEFRQADGKSSRKYSGTGLGLAIARKYAQMLHGNIEVKSKENAGSIFVVTLPEKPFEYKFSDAAIEEEQINPIVRPEDSVSSKSGNDKTLLLVEDSEPQIIQLTDILREEGYTLRVARNGKEALEAIHGSIPDAMILDLMMPEVDGFEVLKSIRSQKETSQIPVLILSAKHVTKEELSFLKSNHVYQLIQKGDVNRIELLSHVHNMVYSPEQKIQEPIQAKTPAKPIQGKASLLLIEDNDDNTTTVKALMGDKYELVTAADGLTGLEKAKMLVPDLILLDISLPEMDGYSVLKEIKKDKQLQYIPVIALTARAMKGDREDLLSHGFDDYISKPIDHDLFEKTLFDWLEGGKET
jgi:PAS domain S-box-containing protein